MLTNQTKGHVLFPSNEELKTVFYQVDNQSPAAEEAMSPPTLSLAANQLLTDKKKKEKKECVLENRFPNKFFIFIFLFFFNH